ncbi:Transposase [Deinococcus deserti]|uniref:Uncharacterized protein n=1 Tax=Deinococcus deserti (strain DSM 17065 / CIP 109153 / LMG 22923 / VCD115) TaxID=546414 RepID=C1D3S9_DEIDV|nr:Hypothetical protein Deide_3p02033 [Deinococcus deserti VCD115]
MRVPLAILQHSMLNPTLEHQSGVYDRKNWQLEQDSGDVSMAWSGCTVDGPIPGRGSRTRLQLRYRRPTPGHASTTRRLGRTLSRTGLGVRRGPVVPDPAGREASNSSSVIRPAAQGNARCTERVEVYAGFEIRGPVLPASNVLGERHHGSGVRGLARVRLGTSGKSDRCYSNTSSRKTAGTSEQENFYSSGSSMWDGGISPS